MKRSRSGLKAIIRLFDQGKSIEVARGTDGPYRASMAQDIDKDGPFNNIKHPHRIRRFRWFWQAKQQAHEWRRRSS